MSSSEPSLGDVIARAGGAIFVFTGLLHFLIPGVYEDIIPSYLPDHRALVYASGVAELAGGLAVWNRRTRTAGGWVLVLTVIAVFPANVHMALNADDYPKIPAALLWLRLPLQVPILAWAWYVARQQHHTARYATTR